MCPNMILFASGEIQFSWLPRLQNSGWCLRACPLLNLAGTFTESSWCPLVLGLESKVLTRPQKQLSWIYQVAHFASWKEWRPLLQRYGNGRVCVYGVGDIETLVLFPHWIESPKPTTTEHVHATLPILTPLLLHLLVSSVARCLSTGSSL